MTLSVEDFKPPRFGCCASSRTLKVKASDQVSERLNGHFPTDGAAGNHPGATAPPLLIQEGVPLRRPA